MVVALGPTLAIVTRAAATTATKGKGANLPVLGLPWALPVTVQLVTSDGGRCWAGVHAPGGCSSGTGTAFKGRQN